MMSLEGHPPLTDDNFDILIIFGITVAWNSLHAVIFDVFICRSWRKSS